MSSPSESAPSRRRGLGLLLAAAAVLSILVPALFWRGTWFGRVLDDTEMAKYLAEEEKPRHVQHALSQISDRIQRGDPGVAKFLPRVIELARSPSREIRITTAWVLGQDPKSEAAHAALLELLSDAEPMVRRNAALSLVRFQDDAGHDEIVAMLKPYTQVSPAAGGARLRLKPEDSVDVGTLLARIEAGDTIEVRSDVPGRVLNALVEDGADVAAGAPLYLLAPSDDETFEALRALYLVGRPGDLEEITASTGPGSVVSTRVRQQAALTSEAIRGRAEGKP